MQREKKVVLTTGKSLKTKKTEAEESRIDFQLTWDNEPLHDVLDNAVVDQGSTEPTQISNPVRSKKISQKLMLLEVKSVTLAMRSSIHEEVRLLRQYRTVIINLRRVICLTFN